MFFKYFSRQILFSRTFHDSPVYSSTFQACANPKYQKAMSHDVASGSDITPCNKITSGLQISSVT